MSMSYVLGFGGLLTKSKGKVKSLKVSGEFELADSKGLKKMVSNPREIVRVSGEFELTEFE